ncbi:hypothetical protein BKI52_43100 [marine bacterium AO1-C]|nr:hypothetical protein BKI52_43100 [marine bacterium AO1-C]
MKQLIFITLLLGLANCTYSQNKRFKPTKGMIALSPLAGAVKLKVGQKAYYQTTVHGSVGFATRVSSASYRIFKLIDTHFAYKDARKAEMSGGDKGTKTFIFEALKRGNTVLTIKDIFRSQVKATHKIKVTVE